jgi:hypothetical protein
LGDGIARAARYAFVANGPVSIAGALLTTLLPGWVMNPVGLVAFALWNVLLATMAVLTLRVLAQPVKSLQ